MAHEWIQSYLTGRRQFVTMKGEWSDEQQETCDVPQRSILGPNLYEGYAADSMAIIFRKHDIFHIYADDTQAYIPFSIDEEVSLHRLECCLHEIRKWMAANWVKLNDSKTEFIIFGSKRNLAMVSTYSVTGRFINRCICIS